MKNLIDVFQDTIKLSKSIDCKSNTSKYSFSDIIFPLSQSSRTNNVKVIPLDTVSAISEYNKIGRTCILNMASFKRPGGVANGARAQEESLFRCSNLSLCVPSDLYPISMTDCLYTLDSIFFKDVNYDLMNPEEVDVITIPAVNLNSMTISKSDYVKFTLDKIRLMCSIPSKFGVSNLILGAWGCGVFKNDPELMSDMFSQVLIDEGYSSFYDNVIFAIINDHNSVGNNYSIFKNKFKN